MEKIDLIDRQDNVIGVTDTKKAHQEKQLHRLAAVYVFNDKGQLYVQVHKSSGGLLDHSVGGHVSFGESYEVAAAREAEEELGIKQPLNYLSTFYSDEVTYLHMFGLFECIADSSWKFIPNDEVEEIILMDLKDIWDMMNKTPKKFTGGFINTMKEYRRIKNI